MTFPRAAATVLLALVWWLAAPPAALAQQTALRSWGYQLQNIDPAKLAGVPYDAIVIDYTRDGSDGSALTAAEVQRLKFKPDGSRRIVLAYMSIGEAESYRWYWSPWWNDLWFIPNIFTKPGWCGPQNGDWKGNYAVRYWDPEWQRIIVGGGGYLDRLLKAGFDGVWLDKVDSAFEKIAAARPTARADMIDFVGKIAAKARKTTPGFLVFPQNAELLLDDPAYRRLIDGIGKEDLLYGEDSAGKPNSPEIISKNSALLKLLAADGKPVLSVEYLDDQPRIDAARRDIQGFGFVPHFADRELAAMRIGDYPGSEVKRTARAKSRTREAAEPSTYDIWKRRLLIAAAVVVILLGLVRRNTAR